MGNLLRQLLRWLSGRPDKVMYIGGSDTLPPPLPRQEEAEWISRLEQGELLARQTLIERNLRLVVYIARRFENTGINIEDLISIGTIGLIKAINTFRADKNIKLATYASRCIENEILMYLRKNAGQRTEVSFDEPLNTDWDGNELLLSDEQATEADVVMRPIEEDVERDLLAAAINVLSPREKQIITLRFGLGGGKEQTQKEVGPAGHLAELHQPARKAHHRAPAAGNAQADAVLKTSKAAALTGAAASFLIFSRGTESAAHRKRAETPRDRPPRRSRLTASRTRRTAPCPAGSSPPTPRPRRS